MKLIIGLGNPGTSYKETRHNAGFVFIDALKDNLKFPEFTYNKKFDADVSEGFVDVTEKIILAKPQTFMNNSGRSVRALIDFYKLNPEEIIVVADDLDIEIGKYKISTGARATGHNGIQSIMDNIGTQDFTRIRIGIETKGGRRNRGPISGKKFVLQKFSETELHLLQDTINKVIDELQKNYFNKILLK